MPIKPNVTVVCRILRWSPRSPSFGAYTLYNFPRTIKAFFPMIRLKHKAKGNL